MVKKICLLFFLFVGCSSCKYFYHTAPRHIKNNFIHCYDGINTGIDTLLNIEGYYDFIRNDNSYSMWFMFYNDGTYVHGIYPADESRQFYLEDLNDNEEIKKIYDKDKIWGRYVIQGDTIKIQVVYRPDLGSMSMAWYLFDIWFKIIDKNTIIGIYPPTRYPIDSKKKSYMRSYGFPAKFTPLKTKPESNSWIKQEKWFWCHESDWKEYMEEVKHAKKKLKSK